MNGLDSGYFHGPRQDVVHKASGHQLSVLVISNFFEQGGADSLGHSTVYLPVDKERIDQFSGVVSDGIVEEFNFTRLDVDLDNCNVSGIRPGDGRWNEIEARFEPRLELT